MPRSTTDSTRTTLSTTLVAYNCYSPPRTAAEFREFAKLMPSAVIGDSIDGLGWRHRSTTSATRTCCGCAAEKKRTRPGPAGGR